MLLDIVSTRHLQHIPRIDFKFKCLGGLWTFDGSTFKPINLEASTYAEFAYNQNKYYYSAYWLGWEQLFVYEPSSNKNFTVLTDLTQTCSECFSDLTPMADGRIAFEYNSQVGTSDGTIAGTSLLTGKPRIANIIGTFENRVYCSDFFTEHLLSTDGTPGGTKNLTNAVVRRILTFNGKFFVIKRTKVLTNFYLN